MLTGGESYRQLLDRAPQKLDEIIEQNSGGKITVFSRTRTICILALHPMSALDAPELKLVWISNANCGIRRFDLDTMVSFECSALTIHVISQRCSP